MSGDERPPTPVRERRSPGLAIWTVTSPEDLTRVAEQAVAAERLGFSGIAFGDSQGRSGDTVVAMTLAASSTQSIGIGSAVTNPFTRHPATLASAFASLQGVSGGRMTLGIGRGDSSLAFLGLAPAPLGYFERYLHALRSYLTGRKVAFEDLPPSVLPSAATMPLGERPEASELRWLQDRHLGVEIDVAASGPKVIALAARVADRVSFAVGADPVRLHWAVGVAREARSLAGLDPDGLTFGAYITVAVDEDPAEARRQGGGIMTALSRLSVMHGTVNGPADENAQAVLATLSEQYAMSGHAESASHHGQMATDAYAERYGLYGPPELFVERLREMAEIGISRVIMVPPLKTSDPDGVTVRRVGEEVIPALEVSAPR